MFCFNAAWTTLFSTTYLLWYVDGTSHFLANVASSVVWLIITSALWVRICRKIGRNQKLIRQSHQGSAAGIMHNTRTGGDCARRATISRCRQSLTVEALGWTEFGLCALVMLTTCLWVHSNRWTIRHLADSASASERLV